MNQLYKAYKTLPRFSQKVVLTQQKTRLSAGFLTGKRTSAVILDPSIVSITQKSKIVNTDVEPVSTPSKNVT